MQKKPLGQALLRTGVEKFSERVAPPGGSFDDGLPQPARDDGRDPRLKKIYIYADNIFTPQSLTDSRTVRVRTAAFDLTGYFDFTKAPPADTFQIEVRVTMAHASDVLLQRNYVSAGTLITMRQIAGDNYISGNHIDIIITQLHSTDNFVTKTPIAYQLIVESS